MVASDVRPKDIQKGEVRSMPLIARRYDTGDPVSISITHGLIEQITPVPEGAAIPWVAPALIDAQVNGFQGHNFNSAAATVETVRGALEGLWGAGVGLFCPTVTTGSFAQMAHALRTIAAACDTDRQIAHAVAMIHVEGPYISPQDGPRGAHPLAHVRLPDWDEFARLSDAAGERIGMVTLAPELEGAIPFIERLAKEGIIVALGHHAAPADVLHAAVAAGARTCTHLGNGAHATLPRHPNYLWEQLGCDDLWTSIIADGHHLAPSVVRCFVRAKGLDRTILVSDAVFLAGMPPGTYQVMDHTVELTTERKVTLAGTPYLAGSALQLAEGVGNVARFAGLSLRQAIDLAAANPARLLGVDAAWGCLEAGRTADLLLFDWDAKASHLTVRALLAEGRPVWPV